MELQNPKLYFNSSSSKFTKHGPQTDVDKVYENYNSATAGYNLDRIVVREVQKKSPKNPETCLFCDA